MYDAMQFLVGHAILLFYKILLYEMIGHIDQKKTHSPDRKVTHSIKSCGNTFSHLVTSSEI